MTVAPLRPAPDVALVDDDEGAVYLARLPDGPVLVLEGSAALVLRAVLRHTRPAAVEALVAQTGADTGEVEPAMATMVDRLLVEGWLCCPDERTGPTPGQPPTRPTANTL